jgi:hypothetical protein
MPTVSVNLSTEEYVKVNSGFNPILVHAHRDSVRVAISAVKPAKANKVFHLIGDKHPPLPFLSIDTNMWALALTDKSSLIVSETTPTPVSYGDSASLDAFERLRVSYPVAVFENKNIHNRKRSQFEEPMSGSIIVHGTVTGGPFQVAETITGGTSGIIGIVTIVGAGSLTYTVNHNDFVDGETITGGTSGATAVVTTHDTGSHVSHNRTQAAAIIQVGDLADDYAIRQTHRYFPYVPGKSHEIWQTFSFGPSDAPVLVHRSSSSGSLVDVEIHQNDPLQSTDGVSTWNLDKMDGTGLSGINLDWTKDQFLVTEMQWQGDGRVRMGFFVNGRIIYAHEFNFSNTLDNVYMSTPSLPVRSEIYNVDGTTISRMHGYFDEENGLFIKQTSTDPGRIIREICTAIVSMSGENPSGLGFTVSNRVAARAINNTSRSPVLAVRLKAVHPSGGKNRVTVELAGSSFFPTGNSANFELVHSHDPSAITATWNDVGAGSACEYSTDITTITSSPGHTIDEGYAAAGAAGKGNIASEVQSKKNDQHRFLSQNFDSTNSQVFVLYGEALAGNAQGYGTISWTEFD